MHEDVDCNDSGQNPIPGFSSTKAGITWPAEWYEVFKNDPAIWGLLYRESSPILYDCRYLVVVFRSRCVPIYSTCRTYITLPFHSNTNICVFLFSHCSQKEKNRHNSEYFKWVTVLVSCPTTSTIKRVRCRSFDCTSNVRVSNNILVKRWTRKYTK
jgi:hypothetical protein